MQKAHEFFNHIARVVSTKAGQPIAFILAMLTVIVWAATGPIFHFSETWQLVINTGTTIVTFLMVFLIQNAQNHDSKAMHLKLDEVIRSVRGARNRLINLEALTDQELDVLEEQFNELRKKGGDGGGSHKKRSEP